jgi:hypothetical protein
MVHNTNSRKRDEVWVDKGGRGGRDVEKKRLGKE